MLRNEQMTVIVEIAIHDNGGMRSTKENIVYSVLFLFTSSHGMRPAAAVLVKIYLMRHGARSQNKVSENRKEGK